MDHDLVGSPHSTPKKKVPPGSIDKATDLRKALSEPNRHRILENLPREGWDTRELSHVNYELWWINDELWLHKGKEEMQ